MTGSSLRYDRLGLLLYFRYVFVYVLLLSFFTEGTAFPEEPVMQVTVILSTRSRGANQPERINWSTARFETTIQLELVEAYIGVGLLNNGTDCLEPWVYYNITEGAGLIGNIDTRSGGGVNVGPVTCLARGESAHWSFLFLPRSVGKVVIALEFESRYSEWGEPKVYKPPGREIVLNIIPRQEPSYSGGIIMVGILVAAALVIGLGVKIRSSERPPKTPMRQTRFIQMTVSTLGEQVGRAWN